MHVNSDPLSGFCYCTVSETDEKGNHGLIWTRCTLFNEEEEDAIQEAGRILDRFFINVERMNAVIEAYQEFINDLHSLNSGGRDEIARLDRRFRAYVMEWRLFLDHWKKYIEDGAQTEGWSENEKNDYIEAFKKLYDTVTKAAYESIQEYVVANPIRNHVVHANNSIYHAHVGVDGNQACISRDALLNDHHISASQREIVEKLDEQIDLEWVADGSLKAMQEVNEAFIRYQIDSDVITATVALVGAYERIRKEKIDAPMWMFIRSSTKKKDGKINLSYQQFDFGRYVRLAVYLSKVMNTVKKEGDNKNA